MAIDRFPDLFNMLILDIDAKYILIFIAC